MTDYLITDEYQRVQAMKSLEKVNLPATMSLVKGKRRTVNQNKLQRLWNKEIAAQREDESAEYYRGYNKLTFGIPILCNDSLAYEETYNRIIKPLSYTDKLAMMMEPLDYSVTRLMTSKQKYQFLNELFRHWTVEGIQLTDPNNRFHDEYIKELKQTNGGG